VAQFRRRLVESQSVYLLQDFIYFPDRRERGVRELMIQIKQNVRQLLIDADDTLWENNIYYLKASNALFDLIAAKGFDRASVESEFDSLEIKIVHELGYGSKNYAILMRELFDRYNALAEHSLSIKEFNLIVDNFLSHPSNLILFEDVIPTIRYLKSKYSVYVLTKGNRQEQEHKLITAGIAEQIDNYFIVDEKNDHVYESLMKEYKWDPRQTCMIGNSPKSDINPALRCGMYAIYIPYSETWKLDNEPLTGSDGKLITLTNFAELMQVL